MINATINIKQARNTLLGELKPGDLFTGLPYPCPANATVACMVMALVVRHDKGTGIVWLHNDGDGPLFVALTPELEAKRVQLVGKMDARIQR